MKKQLLLIGLVTSSLFYSQVSNTETRDDAGAPTVISGFYQTINPTNYPAGATNLWHLLDVRHTNPINNYGMQFAGSFYDQELWFRKTSNDGSQPWRKAVLETPAGNVGIGTDNPQYKLDVIGKSSFTGNVKVDAKIEAKEIKVTLTPTADFVFAEDYALPKLEDIEKHIKAKKHLPEIASAKEMEKEGVNVGEFQIKLLQKIEELTLYTIEQNKQLQKLQEDNEKVMLELAELKNTKN